MQDIILIFFLSFLISCTISKYMIKLLQRYSVMDIPINRSNHKTPIPRGGGVSIVVTILIFSLLYYSINNKLSILYFISSLIIVATISFIDDIKNLPIIPRVLCQSIAISILYNSFDVSFIDYSFLKYFILLFIFIFINFYNFMDGIDGSASSEAIHIGISILIINLITGNILPEVQFIMIVLIAACIGFLVFNWHPAKIFLGDVGSISLGIICAWALVNLVLSGYLAAALIIPLYYISDSFITILIRLYQGKKIWHGHSEHFFQKAVRNGASHKQVIKKIIFVNLILCALSVVSLWYPKSSLMVSLIFVAIFLYKLQKPTYNNSKNLVNLL